MRRTIRSAKALAACAFALVALGEPRNAHADGEPPVNSYIYFDVGMNTVHDVNDAGIIVGELDGRAYMVWNGGWAELGTLGGTYEVAYAINNGNQVVGESWTSGGPSTAFLWDSTKGMQDLGTMGGYSAWAADINDAGQVVGCVVSAAGTSNVFLWQDGSSVDLGVPAGYVSIRASGINASGQVVGFAIDADGAFRAFRWTPTAPNGSTGSWAPLHGSGGNIAIALNRSGDAVGYVSAGSAPVPTLWDGSGAHALGSFGSAVAINDSRLVVGYDSGGAFVWDEVHGARELTALASPESLYGGIAALRFWDAGAINASGQIIATIEDYSNFLLTPSPLPPQPKNLRASTGVTGRSLSWSASNSAGSYHVKRGTSMFGPFTTLGTTSGTSWTDTTAETDAGYYYAVSALNSYGESIESDAAYAQPDLPPAPPTNLRAAAGKSKGTVILMWTQSSSAGVVQNRIYRSTSSSGGYSLVATIGAGTTYTDRNLVRRTTYYYVVTAVGNSGKESVASNQASIRLR